MSPAKHGRHIWIMSPSASSALSLFWFPIVRQHARIQRIFPEGVQLFFIFLVNEWIQIPLTRAIIGTPAKRNLTPAKRHLIAFRWRADDGPTLNAGLVVL